MSLRGSIDGHAAIPPCDPVSGLWSLKLRLVLLGGIPEHHQKGLERRHYRPANAAFSVRLMLGNLALVALYQAPRYDL